MSKKAGMTLVELRFTSRKTARLKCAGETACATCGAGIQPAQAGMTLVELIVAFTILMVLTSMAVPLARSNVQRIRERQLREALHDMRAAIDKYKDLADGGKLGIQKMDAYGYPESLQALVDGVKGSGQAADVKLKFLRRIPRDPMTNSYEWGVRSMQDDPKSQGWGGQNVFDVYSKSDQTGSDGRSYAEW